MTYAKDKKRVDQLVASIPGVGVDSLEQIAQECSELLGRCRARLRETEQRVADALKKCDDPQA